MKVTTVERIERVYFHLTKEEQTLIANALELVKSIKDTIEYVNERQCTDGELNDFEGNLHDAVMTLETIETGHYEI